MALITSRGPNVQLMRQRIAPVLGQPIHQDHRVVVHILDVGSRRHQFGRVAARRAGVDVMRIEFIQDQRALVVARHLHPAPQPVILHHLAGGIAGIAGQDRLQAPPLDLPFQVGQRRLVALVRVEQDGDGDEALKTASNSS